MNLSITIECDGYCLNGRTCTSAANGSNPICDCGQQWTGAHCEQLVTTTTAATVPTTTPISLICTHLDSTYCNSGTCVEVNNRAQCQCPPTYTGTRCEILAGVTQPSM